MEYFSIDVEQALRFLKTTPEQAKESKTFNTVSGGVEICPTRYNIKRDSFKYHTVEIVTSGNGNLILDGKNYKLNPGTIFIYYSGIPHSIKTDQAAMTKYFINFSGEEPIKIIESILKKYGSVFYCKNLMNIINTFDEIIKYGLEKSQLSEDICDALVRALLLKVYENGLTIEERRSLSLTRYEDYKQIIKNNFLKFKNLQEIANYFNTSTVNICKLFKKYHNQTPYQYLIQLKMNYALELLNNNDNKVKDVATELGFDDSFNFTRTFKRSFGISPKSYQKSVLSNS